tara:strand:+ start:942 stop:2963 length:2022 start_codon:yes stop_codon:yes gene_type:complete
MSLPQELLDQIKDFSPEELAETFSQDELNKIESLLNIDPEVSRQTALNKQLGISLSPSLEAGAGERPLTEMSPIGQTLGSAVAPLLAGTQKGQQIGEAVGAGLGAAATAAFRRPLVEPFKKGGKVVGGLTQSALAAFGGGALGYEGERNTRNALNDQQFQASLSSSLRAGGEEAMWDVAGNSLVKGGSLLASKIKFRPKEGAEELQTIMQKEGSTLALDQLIDNRLVGFMGELLRGSTLTSGAFENLASKQSDIVVKHFDGLVADFAGVARSSLENGGLGRVVQGVVTEGKQLHSEATGVLFNQLDDAAFLVSRGRKEVPIDGPADKFFTEAQKKEYGRTETLDVFVPPVDVTSIRKDASSLIDDIKRIGVVDPTGEGMSLLKGISEGASGLTFKETHQLMSDLKRIQREPSFKGTQKSLKIPKIIEQLQKSFDTAGSKLPDDLALAYKRARTFSKFGASRFNEKFIDDIVNNTSPSTLGDIITKSTPENIFRLRKAMRLSDKRAGRAVDSYWNKVQAGVLETLLPQNVEQLGKAPITARNTDRNLKRMLGATFEKGQLASLDKGMKIIEEIVLSEKTRGNYGNRVAGLLLLGGGGFYAAGGESTLPAAVMSFIVAPRLLSRALTSPAFVRNVTELYKSPKNSKGYRVAALKMATIIDDIQKEVTAEEEGINQ